MFTTTVIVYRYFSGTVLYFPSPNAHMEKACLSRWALGLLGFGSIVFLLGFFASLEVPFWVLELLGISTDQTLFVSSFFFFWTRRLRIINDPDFPG